MKKDEISAIDAIFEILESLSTLDKRMSVVEDNLKLLNNKISKLNKNIVTNTEPIQPQAQFGYDQGDQPQLQMEPDRLVLGNIKVYGYIVNRERKPLEGVSVNVFDDKNKLLRNISSDSNGYWESRLPSGSYGVEYIHKKFKPINKSIKLEDGMKTFEVR